jgi:serine/threonine-protein kinase
MNGSGAAFRDGRPFDVRQAVSFAAQAASAVRDANRAGIIHRDIKPDNCLLTDEGRLKLSDFGIAKREAEPAPDPEEVGLAGTLGFMSPERLTADSDLLAKFPYRDDVFALGALLYEVLTGRNPFYLYEDDQGRPLPPDVYANKNAIWPLQLRSIQYDPPAPSAVRPNHGITENLDRIALKALSKDPAERHEDVQRSWTTWSPTPRRTWKRPRPPSSPKPRRRTPRKPSAATPGAKTCKGPWANTGASTTSTPANASATGW